MIHNLPTPPQSICEWTAHLSEHHDDAVRVQEARRVPLVQPHVGLHRGPGAAAAELLLLGLRAGALQITSRGLLPRRKALQTQQLSWRPTASTWPENICVSVFSVQINHCHRNK